MPGKRKRDVLSSSGETQVSGLENVSAKPMSAVAAAKLRLQASQEAVTESVAPTSETEPIGTELVSSASEGEDDDEPPIYHNQQLCTFRANSDTVISDTDDELSVSLKKNTTIALLGCFDFVVLKGAININGANFAASPRRGGAVQGRAHVPSTLPITSVKGLDTRNEVRFLTCEEPLPLANLSPHYVDIWNARKLGTVGRSFTLITESDADPLGRSLIPEIVPDDWIQEVEDCAISPSVTFVTGAPSSGGSYFARRLLNRFLTGHGRNAKPLESVYYLDLDPGNPGYTPHGQISLVLVKNVSIAPAFVNASTTLQTGGKNTVMRAHAVRSRWSPDSISHFFACSQDLLRRYSILRERGQSVPLIVNTPGWLHSTSFNTLIKLLSQSKLQRLVHLTNNQTITEMEAAKLDALETTARKGKFVFRHVSALSNLSEASHSEEDLRSMQMMSYFHCTGRKTAAGAEQTWNPKPLSCITPVEFSYEQTPTSNQAFIGFQTLSEWVDPSQLLTVLNGSVIQIVETEDEDVQHQFGKIPRTNKSRIPYFNKLSDGSVTPLNPATSRLVCTALLRSFNLDRKVVQLIIPKTHKSLVHDLKPEKTVFVFGCCEHPEWAYTQDAYQALADAAKGQQMEADKQDLAPWVAPASTFERMGYLNVPRRIRRFHGGD